MSNSTENSTTAGGFAGNPNAFLPGDWFFEFDQDYGDGIHVIKRGLDASLLVVRKYDIGTEEVLAFSTYDGKRRAMTVFHFHPDFDLHSRRHYMEAHREGYDVARTVTSHLEAQRAERQAAIRRRVAKARRAVTLAAHAAAVFILAHYSPGR
ncbi:hypothetical protein KFF05_02970 [bacterium SCSIO 12827]|nr:hypothetical protein KFF05_02970 [bacterium SCSIO 12827]